METPRSSKDSDNSAAPDSESPAPKKRTSRLTRGKPAAPRGRKKVAETEESPAAAAAVTEAVSAPPAPEPVREPELPLQAVYSFSPDDEPAPEAPAPAPSPREEPAPAQPVSGDAAPGAAEASAAPETGQAPAPAGEQPQGTAGFPPGKRFGREYFARTLVAGIAADQGLAPLAPAA